MVPISTRSVMVKGQQESVVETSFRVFSIIVIKKCDGLYWLPSACKLGHSCVSQGLSLNPYEASKVSRYNASNNRAIRLNGSCPKIRPVTEQIKVKSSMLKQPRPATRIRAPSARKSAIARTLYIPWSSQSNSLYLWYNSGPQGGFMTYLSLLLH